MSIDPVARGLAAYANSAAGISAAGGALRTDLLIPTAWTTLTAYAANAAVTESGVAYLAVVAHTSGTFATDLAAGKWVVYQGVTTAALSDNGDSTKGSALVGHRKSTALAAIDRSQPELQLTRLKNALSTIKNTGTGTASLMCFGDSITRSLLPADVIRQLYRTYGWRGALCGLNNFDGQLYDTSNLTGGAASGTTTNTNRFTVAPNGCTFSLTAAGNRVTFGGLAAFHPAAYVNRATVVYVKKPGGGVFKAQTIRARSRSEEYPQDVIGATAIDTSDATTSLATLVIDLPAREVGARVTLSWVSGDVEIKDCLMEDTTAAGLIVSFQDLGGIGLTSSNTMIPAALTTMLTVLHPDLIYWSMKEEGVAANLVTMQALWDGAYPTDWIFSAPYPDSTYATEVQARSAANPVIAHAIANGHDYWDPLPDCPTYAYGVAQGWYGDTTHWNTTATYTLGPRLARDGTASGVAGRGNRRQSARPERHS